MDTEEYSLACLKTESKPTKEMGDMLASMANVFAGVLFKASRAGNAADRFKKRIFYNKVLSRNKEQEIVFADIENSHGDFVEKCKDPDFLRLVHCFLGLLSEAGELGNEIAKSIMERRKIDSLNIQEELGDAQWYIPIGCIATGITLGDMMEMNKKKLCARYKDGSFDFTLATKRDTKNEEEAMEAVKQQSSRAIGATGDVVD